MTAFGSNKATAAIGAGILIAGGLAVIATGELSRAGRGGEPMIGIPATITAPAPAYPLKASHNNRYLVDQHDKPFMIVGDSPQSLMARMSREDAEFYLANRQRYGVNALWVHLLSNEKTAGNPDEGQAAVPRPS